MHNKGFKIKEFFRINAYYIKLMKDSAPTLKKLNVFNQYTERSNYIIVIPLFYESIIIDSMIKIILSVN